MENDMIALRGLLYTKYSALNTRSEGPDYYIQTYIGDFLLKFEERPHWERDYHLEFYNRKMVEVVGYLTSEKVKTYRDEIEMLKINIQTIEEIPGPSLCPDEAKPCMPYMPLKNTLWELNDDTEISITFRIEENKQSEVIVSSTCTQYSGNIDIIGWKNGYIPSEAEIRISNISSTQGYRLEAEKIVTKEQMFLASLEKAMSYKIEKDILTVYYGDNDRLYFIANRPKLP